MGKKSKNLKVIFLIIFSALFLKTYGQTDYILQGLSNGTLYFIPPNSSQYIPLPPPNPEIDSIKVLAFQLPPVLKPGMSCKVRVVWKFWTAHVPITYVNYFGDWQPNTELARSSMYGGIPSPNEVFIDTFTFMVPNTPKWYRIRFMAYLGYSPITNFYGTPNKVPQWFSEIIFHSGYPLGSIEEENNEEPVSSRTNSMNIYYPFGRNMKIVYTILKETDVNIKIFDTTGRLVKEAFQGHKLPGTYSFIWDGKDEKGKYLPSGEYFYVVEIDKDGIIDKIILIK
jgi:hypothetical protein